jgi:hypothetical protein
MSVRRARVPREIPARAVGLSPGGSSSAGPAIAGADSVPMVEVSTVNATTPGASDVPNRVAAAKPDGLNASTTNAIEASPRLPSRYEMESLSCSTLPVRVGRPDR